MVQTICGRLYIVMIVFINCNFLITIHEYSCDLPDIRDVISWPHDLLAIVEVGTQILRVGKIIYKLKGTLKVATCTVVKSYDVKVCVMSHGQSQGCLNPHMRLWFARDVWRYINLFGLIDWSENWKIISKLEIGKQECNTQIELHGNQDTRTSIINPGYANE